jgi:ribonucleoside-diphosphate reductase alpha chain
MNVFMENATTAKLTSMHFHAWQKGLKTGMYYLRTKAATDAIKFTVSQDVLQETKRQNTNIVTNALSDNVPTTYYPSEDGTVQSCLLDDPDCEACSA